MQGSFTLSGTAPSFDDLKKFASGLVTDVQKLEKNIHKFHFCVDSNQVLILWMNKGELYQRVMGLSESKKLMTILDRLGFTCKELD